MIFPFYKSYDELYCTLKVKIDKLNMYSIKKKKYTFRKLNQNIILFGRI